MTMASTKPLLVTILACACLFAVVPARAQHVMENLGRGVVAVRSGEKSAYVGWRLLAIDPAEQPLHSGLAHRLTALAPGAIAAAELALPAR